MPTVAPSEMLVGSPVNDGFTRVAQGVDAYVVRLMRGGLWGLLLFAPLETALALSGSGGWLALGFGALTTVAAVISLATSERLLRWMRMRPWSLPALAVVVAVVLWLTESSALAGYFGSLVYLPIALAALAGLPREAVLCALVAMIAAVGRSAWSTEESLASLAADERWLLNLALPLMLAIGLSVPVWYLVRFIGALPIMLGEVRAEAQDPVPPLELPAGTDPWLLLSAAEQRVVARLPEEAPKQIAVSVGLSIATVRCHLQRAKRATGARTQAELAAWAALNRPAGPVQ